MCWMTHVIAIVKLLMYGFGDVANPAADSIAVMDDLVIDYITEMVFWQTSQREKRILTHGHSAKKRLE